MAKVFNWQLNREMEFPYEGRRPKRQFVMIMDPNKCIGCQTCTINCKQTWTWSKGQEYMFWNNVESKPFGFYPVGWDVRLLEAIAPSTWESGTYTGKTIFESGSPDERANGFLPADEDWAYPNLGEDEPSEGVGQGAHLPGLPHAPWVFYLARICNHCTYPGCLAGCPRGAIYKRPEDGIVLVDQTRCRGYRECVRACPYKKTLFNTETGVSEKCIACYPALRQGKQNQCVVACIGRIRLTGFMGPPDEVNEENPIDYLIKVRKAVLPLYPQTGTEPNVYYFPSINTPLPFLRQMLGPGADAALETYRAAAEDKQLLGLLMLFGSTDRIIHRFKVKKDRAYGYDESGEEIVSVPLKEPVFIRPYRDKRYGTFRLNIT